ncbi:UDP-glucuronic acid decarboxylase 1-like isoform X2 [Acanthaster planci]|uniref:UDP-glucuronic acid decarboxylase 1 n=1 Tax=Acanthaster planci TaxID=133434 RepID=A0A8B7ZN62_ACAPL|nr:UDP-glucuronic acid decarboxylase 1-like isoform X2 [Acanthaster planci]
MTDKTGDLTNGDIKDMSSESSLLCGTRGEEDSRWVKDLGEGVQVQLQKLIQPLQERLTELEKQTMKKYPEVRYLPESERKRILITGGAGFVGSHLTDRLMMEGHEVTVVDNFFTGRKRNIEQWVGHPNFELINHDVVEPLLIEVDQIYHLACPASPPHYMYNPIKTIKTSSLGTLNMLGLAKRTRARILQASTSEVYGDPQEHPQTEEYWGHVNPIGPRACYDEGKRVAETMCYAYAKQDKVDVRVARIFNTFGPRMHMNDGRVVSNFILQALQDQPITVYGHGKQSRSFQYVSDLVDGLIKLMNSNESSPVNLGNPDEHTIMEFAQIIRSKIGGNSVIQNVAAAEDDPQRRKPDISKAKKILGWEPVVPLDRGLQLTIDYFRNELEHAAKMKVPGKPVE